VVSGQWSVPARREWLSASGSEESGEPGGSWPFPPPFEERFSGQLTKADARGSADLLIRRWRPVRERYREAV
jgi:hypothetical protein